MLASHGFGQEVLSSSAFGAVHMMAICIIMMVICLKDESFWFGFEGLIYDHHACLSKSSIKQVVCVGAWPSSTLCASICTFKSKVDIIANVLALIKITNETPWGPFVNTRQSGPRVRAHAHVRAEPGPHWQLANGSARSLP